MIGSALGSIGVRCGEAGGRAPVREGHCRLPSRTAERQAEAARRASAVPCRTPRQSCWAPGPVVGVAPVAVSELGDEPARPPTPPSTRTPPAEARQGA